MVLIRGYEDEQCSNCIQLHVSLKEIRLLMEEETKKHHLEQHQMYLQLEQMAKLNQFLVKQMKKQQEKVDFIKTKYQIIQQDLTRIQQVYVHQAEEMTTLKMDQKTLNPFHTLLKETDAFQFQIKQKQEQDDLEIEHIVLSQQASNTTYLHDRFDPGRGLEKMLNQATKGSFLRPMTSLQAKIREKELEIRRLTNQKTKQVQEITEKQQKQALLLQKFKQISSTQQFQLKNLYTTLQKTQKDKQKMGQKIDDLQKYARLLEKKIVDLSSSTNSNNTQTKKSNKKTGIGNSKQKEERILSPVPVWCPLSLDVLKRNSSMINHQMRKQENDEDEEHAEEENQKHEKEQTKNIRKRVTTPPTPTGEKRGGERVDVHLDLKELKLLSPSEIGEESCGNSMELDVDALLNGSHHHQQQQHEEEEEEMMTPGSQVSSSSLSQRIAAALHGSGGNYEEEEDEEEDQNEQSHFGENSSSDFLLFNVHQQTHRSSPAGSPGTHASIRPFPTSQGKSPSGNSSNSGNSGNTIFQIEKSRSSETMQVDAEEFRQLKALQTANQLHKNFVHFYK